MSELMKIDPAQFGIEESKAKEISAQFQPMLDKMVELEAEYNEVIALPIEEKETSAKAKALRLKYVKVRTGTEKIHKEQKAFYLAAGRFVDGWKNTQLFASQGIEEKLSTIENYAELKEKARIAELQAARVEELKQYQVDGSAMQLGIMSDDIWNNFLTGTKTNYEAAQEAARKAEEERLAAIEAEKARIEAQRIENERLKAEAAEREKAIAEERAAAETERKRLEEIARKEREQAEAKLAEERRIAADKLETERKEAARLAAELRAKQEAEAAEAARLAKIESDRIAAERKAAKAPVKEKLSIAVNALVLELPDSEISKEILSKFDGFKKWALTQIEAL